MDAKEIDLAKKWLTDVRLKGDKEGDWGLIVTEKKVVDVYDGVE